MKNIKLSVPVFFTVLTFLCGCSTEKTRNPAAVGDQTPESKSVCGESGDSGSRMEDCARLPDSKIHVVTATGQHVIWKLVARQYDPVNKRLHEVWQDSSTLMLWGDTLDHFYGHSSSPENNAIVLNRTPTACQLDKKVFAMNCQVITQIACGSEDASHANAGIDDKSWGLPTIEEFYRAKADGIVWVLPNMRNVFWTASLSPRLNPENNYTAARVFSPDPDNNDKVFSGWEVPSDIQHAGTDFLGTEHVVRCIGR